MRILEKGLVVGGGYFSPGSDWVFGAIATQFPGDAVIRQVKKNREAAEANPLVIENIQSVGRPEKKKLARHQSQRPRAVVDHLESSAEDMGIIAKPPGRSSRPLPKLDLSDPLVIELSRELRSLDALPIWTKEERRVWSDAAGFFETKLRADWAI